MLNKKIKLAIIVNGEQQIEFTYNVDYNTLYGVFNSSIEKSTDKVDLKIYFEEDDDIYFRVKVFKILKEIVGKVKEDRKEQEKMKKEYSYLLNDIARVSF